MSVESFDPTNMASAPSAETVAAFAAAALAHGDKAADLAPEEVERFAPLATRSDWLDALADADDETLLALVRFITVGEAAHGAWTAGDKSPVIALVRRLKHRGTYPAEMNAWIRSRSTNRFLPHGSLMDRL